MSEVTASFCGLAILLITGKCMRVKIEFLQKLYLPSSVIGGLVGLILLQLLNAISPSFKASVDSFWAAGWSEIAGVLINVVFAALFLGVQIPSPKVVWQKSGPQLMYGMVVAWGQWCVAMLVTAVVLIPVFDVNVLFGAALPIGFAGGHGTAAAFATIFQVSSHPYKPALIITLITLPSKPHVSCCRPMGGTKGRMWAWLSPPWA